MNDVLEVPANQHIDVSHRRKCTMHTIIVEFRRQDATLLISLCEFKGAPVHSQNFSSAGHEFRVQCLYIYGSIGNLDSHNLRQNGHK